MPISKLLLAVVPALALLPATVRTNRGPAPLRTATLETVVEPPEEPRNTYWCVRHGQSTANVENIISSNPAIGSTKHELTALGKEQAHVAGADLWANLSELEVALEDVVVYSSNFTRARETARLASCETCASFRPLRPCLNVVVRQQPAEQSVCHAWRRERACDRTRRRVGYTHNSWIARRRAYAHRRGPRHGQGSVPQAPARAAVFQSVRQRPLPEDRHLGAHHDGRGQPRQHQRIEDERVFF